MAGQREEMIRREEKGTQSLFVWEVEVAVILLLHLSDLQASFIYTNKISPQRAHEITSESSTLSN